jgi:GTP cyclohydrolase I
MTNYTKNPSREDAEDAIRTLLSGIGEDCEREGLLDTPKRVINAYSEFFKGYQQNPESLLTKTFEEVSGYDEIVLLKNMRLESHCEHHMLPILGTAHIAYLPDQRVVGISKIARLLDVYAKRLQTQEKLTSEVAYALYNALKPKGVGVIIDANHQCMSMRGVHKKETSTVTSCMLGVFKSDSRSRAEVLSLMDAK